MERRTSAGGFDSRLQMKQYVAEVDGQFGRFRVFETGDSRYWLFVLLDPSGCDTGIHHPVAKRDVRDDVAYALRRGVGYRREAA